jgi:hypothetical protein
VVRVLDRDDVRRLVSMADAIAAVREAFAAADRGGAVMSAPFGMYVPDAGGEVHVKGAYLAGSPVFAVKTATGFYRDAELSRLDQVAVVDVQEAEGALRLAAAVGRRAGIEDADAVAGLIQGYMGMPEQDQPRSRETARPEAGPLSCTIAAGILARSSSRVSGAPHAATSGPSLLPRTTCTGA